MTAVKPWVCLMYHDVTLEAVRVQGGPGHFAVSRQTFGRQLDQLAAEGLKGRSISDCLATPQDGQVAISFDDGDLGQCEYGCAELTARGMSATFFITTDWVGQPRYVSWSRLRDMKAAGMSIQSHSRSHPFLSELDEPALRLELQGSKEKLDQELGQETDMIALPGGDRPRRSLRPVLRAVGYRTVATSRWGVNRPHRSTDGLVWLHRCTVRGEPSPQHFHRILRGDAWLGIARRTREATLAGVRDALGPTRYARWRRRLLDAVRT